MTKRITTTLLAAMLTLGSGTAALASNDDMRIDAQTEQAIRERLTAQGYTVRKIESEDGLYEAYALKDGRRMELYLDRDLEIVRSKTAD